MKFSNLFDVLRISCFATKREIENSFLNWCGDIDETETKIQRYIEILSDPTLDVDITIIDPMITRESIENTNPQIREKMRQTKISMLKEMEQTFKELGAQYERIMDGDIVTRFQYITENMDIYKIAGLEREDDIKEIEVKINKIIDESYFNNLENDDAGENAKKNEIEILQRIKQLLRDPEKRKQYDEALRKREEEKARTEEGKGSNVIKFTRAISRIKDAKMAEDSRVSDPDAVLRALFGENAARVPSFTQEVQPNVRKASPTSRNANRAPIRTIRDEQQILANPQSTNMRTQSANVRNRIQQSNIRPEKTNENVSKVDRKTTEEFIKQLNERQARKEERKKKTIKGVKRVTAAAIALLIAGGIQYGKQAENDISFGGNSKPAIVETVPVTPDFMPAGVETPTPTPTVEPTPAPVEYDTMLEAYQGFPEGSIYRKVFDDTVLEMTGVQDGSNVEAFIQIMDNNYKAGTDVVTVAEFSRRIGVGLMKAGIIEALYSEDGRVLELDDIVIRQTEANQSTRFIVNGEEMFKTDWARTGNGSIKPYSNEPMTEKMANDIDYLSKLFDATGANKVGVEANVDACIAFTPAVYRRNLEICEDITNGMNPYGIEDGKIGIIEQRPQTQRTINMEDVLKEDEFGLE